MKRDHLLHLVKALSIAEKKVMKKHIKDSSKNKRPYYLELYALYIKLCKKGWENEQIDIELEKILKRKPKMKKGIAKIRYELKEKLQSIILQNISPDHIENKVNNSIKIIEIYINRKLLDEAQLLINETKKKAKLLDLNKHLMELVDWELYLLGKQSKRKDVATQTDLINQITFYNYLFTLELQLKNTFRQLTLIVQKDVLLKKEESLTALKGIYQQLNFEKIPINDYKKAKNTHVVIWYYRVQNLYHRSIREYNKAFKYSQSLITYLESDSYLIKNFESYYVKSICSFTQTCYANQKHRALNQSLEKVKRLYDTKLNYNALIVTCDIGVLYYINSYQYEKALELSNLMEKDWLTIKTKNDNGKLLWYCNNNMLLFWVLNNQSNFNKWLAEGLRISRSDKARDYYFGMRMFELIGDFEQNEWNDFLKKIESLQKTLQNNQSLNAFEKAVLEHFKKLYNIQFGTKTFSLKKKKKVDLKNKAFQTLKIELQTMRFKNEPVNHEAILIWCESHLQNKTIREIFETES